MKVISKSFGNMDNRCYLIVDEDTNKSALVDCSEYSEKMKSLIGDTSLEYILLTHGHYDHIMGVNGISKEYGAKVVISKEDEPMLSSGKLSLASYVGENLDYAKADIIAKEGSVIKLGNLEITVISTKGHTAGGLCYIVEDAIFTGDTLFKQSCGRTDFPSGSEKEMADSLIRLKNINENLTVYSGHGDSSTLDFERNNNPYMRAL